jgi:hypothetical protein
MMQRGKARRSPQCSNAFDFWEVSLFIVASGLMVLPGVCAAVQALTARMHASPQAGLSCRLCARPTMTNAKCRDAAMLQILILANMFLSSLLSFGNGCMSHLGSS